MRNLQRVDRRRHIRLQSELPAQLTVQNQQTIRVTGVAISTNGMQFLCDDRDALKLIPRDKAITLANPVKVTAQFFPTLKRQAMESVSISAEIIEAVRLSESSYQMHLRFVDFAKGSKEAVEDFINKL